MEVLQNIAILKLWTILELCLNPLFSDVAPISPIHIHLDSSASPQEAKTSRPTSKRKKEKVGKLLSLLINSINIIKVRISSNYKMIMKET